MMKIIFLKLFILIFECLRRIINTILRRKYEKQQSHKKEDPISIPNKEASKLEPVQTAKESESQIESLKSEKTLPKIKTNQTDQTEEKILETETKQINNIVKVEQKHSEEPPLKKRPQKPYSKKSPTEESGKKTIKPGVDKEEYKGPKKTIFLGNLHGAGRRRRKRDTAEGRSTDIEKEETEEKEEKTITIVQSPFVEIDLDSAEVWLVLPRQELGQDFFKISTSLRYEVELNEKVEHITAGTENDREAKVYIKESRIQIKEPLNKFRVNFPSELQSREYKYNQRNTELYPFIAVGDSHGRLFYLNDSKGNINPLPSREIWVLLHEDFELVNEPEVTEEKWVWEKYKPFRVNLGRNIEKTESLIVKNKETGKQNEFLSEKTFRLDGEGLVEDDFSSECPLFTGKVIKITAPVENEKGWSVWVQHKEVGARMVCKGWTGSKCLELKIPEDIPIKFGEFQVDICQGNTRTADETLFFRLMPPVELSSPRALIIPDPESGHTPLSINVKIFSDEKWELISKKGDEVKSLAHNHFEIQVPPGEDASCFSVSIEGKPEFYINFKLSIPRLKWKISGQKEWQSKLQKINKKDLKWGEPLYLFINTNDLKNKYDCSAFLEAKGRRLQEAKFIKKGAQYWLRLNDFHDTIEDQKIGSNLRVEIRAIAKNQLLGSIDLLHFEGEPLQEKKKPEREEKEIKIRNLQAFVRSSHKGAEKKGKGFSIGEITAAGISEKNLQLLNIPYDKRRKSTHLRNIDTLKSIKEEIEKEK